MVFFSAYIIYSQKHSHIITTTSPFCLISVFVLFFLLPLFSFFIYFSGFFCLIIHRFLYYFNSPQVLFTLYILENTYLLLTYNATCFDFTPKIDKSKIAKIKNNNKKPHKKTNKNHHIRSHHSPP